MDWWKDTPSGVRPENGCDKRVACDDSNHLHHNVHIALQQPLNLKLAQIKLQKMLSSEE